MKRNLLPDFLLTSNVNLLKLSVTTLINVVIICNERNSETIDCVDTCISTDDHAFNPLFIVINDEGHITEILFLSLINYNWD